MKIKNSPITSLNVYNISLDKHRLTEVTGRNFHSLTYRKKGVAIINIDGKTIISKKD